MSAFIRALRAARIIAGLLALLPICAVLSDGATARVIAAKPQLATGASPAVTTAPVAIEAPARFFSINRVLAEHDRRVALSEAPRFASLNRETVAVDQTPPAAAPQSDEPFGLLTFRAPEGLLWTKWRGVETEIDKEAGILVQCRYEPETCPSSAALRFLAVIDDARNKAGRERFDAVNRAINLAIRYTSDFAQHGVPDLWSAPLATFASGRGDCEDYAIAKYVALRETGTAAEDLRVLLVRDLTIRQDHAVLAVREDGHWLILDNRWTAMLETSEIRNLLPLFAIDHQGVKLFATPYAARSIHESEMDFIPATSEDSASAIVSGQAQSDR
jgi:predicted transglutaminase-like cysteine proteinase